MSESVYAVLAVVGECPLAAMFIAQNNDEAVTKAKQHLPEHGVIRHVLRVCPATLKEFSKNKLISRIAPSDAIVFTAESLLKIIDAQGFLIQSMQQSLRDMRELLDSFPDPTEETHEN